MLNHRFFPLSLITIAALALAACASGPNIALEEARGGFAAAQSDPQVVKLASGELYQAGEALNKANDAWNKGEDAALVDHLAYLAKQRVAIAQETARQKEAEMAAASASAERDRIRLAARTAEADAAQRNAAAAQREAEASQRQAQEAEARSRQLEAQLKELDAKKTARGLVVTLGDVLFDTNKSQLKSGGMRGVQKLADILKQYPQRNVLIEGFTDSTGSSSRNQELSEQRANAVRTALLDTGISADRIATRGYGVAYPVASNATAEGRQLNRRVEIVVSSESETIAPR